MRIKNGTDVGHLMACLQEWEAQLSLASTRDYDATEDLWKPITDKDASYAKQYKLHPEAARAIALSRWYMEAIEKIESHLRSAIDDPNVSELFTDRFWKMMDTPAVTSTFHYRLVCHYQADWLRRVRLQLEALASFAQGTGTIVVPDTNVFAHCGTVRDIDWRSLAGTASVRVIIPHVVVDELDELKRTGRDKDVRLRVRIAISALKQVLGTSPPGSPTAAGNGVTVAILPDPPGHRRLPANDEEICDRAALLRQFANPVVLATNDMGMHVRARAFGLDVLEVPELQAP